MIVQAIVDTYAGMNRALATGIPPWSFATAALVAIRGWANVASIQGQKFAFGGEVGAPTFGLVGEAGPEIIAPKKTYIDVQNELIRRGEIGAGGENTGLSDKLDKLIEIMEDQELKVDFDDDQLAIRVERGNQLLTERNY